MKDFRREDTVAISKLYGQNLRLLRKQNRLSQSDLAAKTGTTKQAISLYETGRLFPRPWFLLAVSGLFGRSINEMLSIGLGL